MSFRAYLITLHTITAASNIPKLTHQLTLTLSDPEVNGDGVLVDVLRVNEAVGFEV